MSSYRHCTIMSVFPCFQWGAGGAFERQRFQSAETGTDQKHPEWLFRSEEASSYLVSLSAQSLNCVWLCNPKDYRPPGSSVRGIFQARILEWVVISSCRGSSQPRDQTLMSCVSCTLAFFTTSATWETLVSIVIVWWKPNFTLSHMLFCPMSKWLFLFLFQVQQFY